MMCLVAACPVVEESNDAGIEDPEPICAAEARRCRGTEVQVCNSAGDGFDFLRDCGADGLICVDGACGSLESCGDGTCEVDENCSVCASDCACPGIDVCVSGVCEARGEDCGDAVCDASANETCSSCGNDCGCPPTDICEAGACVDAPVGDCGDGSCGAGEDCGTCAADCGCDAPDTCVASVCRPPNDPCGDGNCGTGETCANCLADCGCAGTDTCEAGVCTPPPPACGDGACNGTEDCATCVDDCGCDPQLDSCEAGVCVPLPPVDCPHVPDTVTGLENFDDGLAVSPVEIEATFNTRGALAELDGVSCAQDFEATLAGKAALNQCRDLYRCGTCTVVVIGFVPPKDGPPGPAPAPVVGETTWRLSGGTSDIEPDTATCATYESNLWDWEVCVPDCAARICGGDGCGGFCFPGCSLDEDCSADGTVCQVDLCQQCISNCAGDPDCCTSGPSCACDGLCGGP